MLVVVVVFFFFKQKTAYEMRISDWSSDVCSSDLYRPTTIVRCPCRRRSALMDGIDSWLTALGLEQYIEVFRKEEVDLQGLTLLSELDLQDMACPSDRGRGC